jgi:hypothetical protein
MQAKDWNQGEYPYLRKIVTLWSIHVTELREFINNNVMLFFNVNMGQTRTYFMNILFLLNETKECV